MNTITNRRNKFTNDHRAPRRGVSLVVVLAAVALASVIGFALISASALEAQVTHNAGRSVTSEYVAESGVQAAMYYLQYPHLMPASWGTTPGYYIKASDVALPDGFEGTFDLEVTPTAQRDTYAIRATAHGSGDAAPRVVTATARVNRTTIEAAALFGGNINLPLGVTLDGPVQVAGTLTKVLSLIVTLLYPGPLPPTAYRVPTAAEVNYFGADQADGRYLMPDGTSGYAQRLLAAPAATPVANVDNPGRVFYYSNTTTPELVFLTPVVINGTLVVKSGGISVRANSLTINPVPGMPALVVERDVNMWRNTAVLETNGASWVGQRITWGGLAHTGSVLRSNGAWLMPAGANISTGVGGVVQLNYVPAKVDVPLLNRTPQPGQSINVLSWNEP